MLSPEKFNSQSAAPHGTVAAPAGAYSAKVPLRCLMAGRPLRLGYWAAAVNVARRCGNAECSVLSASMTVNGDGCWVNFDRVNAVTHVIVSGISSEYGV